MTSMSENQSVIEKLAKYRPDPNVGFGKTLVPAMVKATYQEGQWSDLELIDYAPIQLDPAAKVLHYAQEIFEGLKAYRNEKDEVYLFRPEMNANRFNFSARRMGMPELPVEMFLHSIEMLLQHCPQAIGNELGQSFYLRPFMIGDEPQLGVKPSLTYQYLLIGGPSGNYFTNPNIKIYVEREAHRAAPLGTGNAKTGGNYAASLDSYVRTMEHGYDQTLWLDPVYNLFVEELSGMNFFTVIDEVLVTPPVGTSILKGITRDSLLKLADHIGIKTEERKINIEELFTLIKEERCTEAFACGTASVVVPISQIRDEEKEVFLPKPDGELALKLKDLMLKIQSGRESDPFDWQYPLKK
jgi:branched-chain amino acid aminotransferase